MVVHPKRARLRAVRLLIVGLAAVLLPALVPPVASADTVHLDVLWVRSQHQSESFSDELRIYVNGQRWGGWDDVDTGETHWYYSSIFPRHLLAIPFSGNTTIEVYEDDNNGQDLGIQGWVNVSEDMLGTGEHEGVADQAPDDGSYVVRFQVVN
jgi:hypothetical protein